MKRLLTILVMMIIMTTGLLSVEKEDPEERLNNYILTFQLEKITYEGVQGFFIPFSGYKQMLLLVNDYIYCQDLLIIKDERIRKLERLEVINFRLKTGLGIAVAFDVGSILLCAGLGILCYNLALYNFRGG